MQKLLHISFAFFILLASTASQTPGVARRTSLLNIEQAKAREGTKAGQIGLTDSNGDQRYSQYVEINPTPVAYTPTATGNPSANYSEFVEAPNGDVWYIDWQGRGILLEAGPCDEDWLQISDNSCPDNINDSIYHYQYASIGARYVWPQAEFLITDSTLMGLQVISGNRNARLALYDNQNGTWCFLDQGGSDATLMLQRDNDFIVKSSTATAPQSAGTLVNHFAVNTSDSTIQAHRYGSGRAADTATLNNVAYWDANGVFRKRPTSDLAGLTPGGTASGDLGGTYPSPTVDGLQGRSVASTAPGTGEVLKWNGTSWAPAADAGVTGTIAADQVAVGTGVNAIGGSTTFIKSGFDLALGSTSYLGSGTSRILVQGSTSGANNYGSIALANPSASGNNFLGAVDFFGASTLISSIRSQVTSGGNTGSLIFYTANAGSIARVSAFDNFGRFIVGSIPNQTGYNEFQGNVSSGIYYGLSTFNNNTSNNSGTGIKFSTVRNGGAVIDNADIYAVKTDNATNAEVSDLVFRSLNGGSLSTGMTLKGQGRLGIGVSPTAVLHLKAGTATANTAPLKLTSGTNLTTPEAGAVEYDGTEFYATNSTASRTILARVLKGSATIDFASTAAGAATDVAFTITGAADGDVVSLGTPNSVTTSGGMYFAWVSAADNVTIRFLNTTGSPIDPGSATFKVTVTK